MGLFYKSEQRNLVCNIYWRKLFLSAVDNIFSTDVFNVFRGYEIK